MKRLACLIFAILFVSATTIAVAAPTSPNYQLKQYSFSSGGTTPDTANQSSKLLGNDAPSSGGMESENFEVDSGTAGQSAMATPQPPTVSNPSQFYDRLKIVLDPGSDPSDTKYAIAISPDDFTTTLFVTPDLTTATSLETSYWQTYIQWGGTSGILVVGLAADTTYSVKVKAIQGDFSESAYSEVAQAATLVPSLTFTVSGPVDMGTLNSSNNYTATANGTLTTSTNAFNGYNIYAFITGQLTQQGGSATINNYSGTYQSPSAWTSGEGFGYTTNDTSIANVAKWNADPCPGGGSPLCYAAFNLAGPGDVVVDHEANLASGPIVDESFTISYKIATSAQQPAGTYVTTIVYTIAPTF